MSVSQSSDEQQLKAATTTLSVFTTIKLTATTEIIGGKLAIRFNFSDVSENLHAVLNLEYPHGFQYDTSGSCVKNNTLRIYFEGGESSLGSIRHVPNQERPHRETDMEVVPEITTSMFSSFNHVYSSIQDVARQIQRHISMVSAESPELVKMVFGSLSDRREHHYYDDCTAARAKSVDLIYHFPIKDIWTIDNQSALEVVQRNAGVQMGHYGVHEITVGDLHDIFVNLTDCQD